jgi:predicted ATPase/class 3 adenylate cyclase
VECPACGAANASSRKFCRACGARLALFCAACGTANEPDDRFCGECGAPLTGAAAGPAPAVPPTAAPAAEERRQVTVLFADLVGFTALAERLDPEEVRDITTRCLRQLADEAVRFEGTVDKLIGDAVMILFGAPVAHEDDPTRALRAALAMQRALERFNAELERTHGLALRLRIGVESGEVVAGPREVGGMVEYTVIGDAVNVAARLQTAAEPGAILVGEGTSQRIESGFRLQAVEPLALRGRERPVAAAVLLAESDDGPDPEPRVPLVGRSAELRALLDRLAALRAGQGGAVVVIGAPGLGKSRLLAELRARASLTAVADDGPRWVRCQAFAHEQAQSYGLARSLVRALAGVGSEERDHAAAAQLRTTLAALDLAGFEAPLIRLLGLTHGEAPTANVSPPPRTGRGDMGPHGRSDEGLGVGDFSALDALSPRDLQRRFFDAVTAVVDALAARRPLVLELDDLHWADPTSVDLLLELLERAGRARLLLCCAFRPEPDAACQALRERGQWRLGDQYAEIGLRPLSEAASAELAARLLGQSPLGQDGAASAPPSALPPALRVLLERAAGTPLWLEELIRTLLERGVLIENGGGWQLAADLDAVELPGSLQALIVARIDRLGSARPTLQVASVIGRRFGRNVLERVAEQTGRLDADLSQAQRADLVRELPAHPEREYDFKHVLVRDAAYATLLHRRRRALHRRVAETVEQLYPERVPELHAVLAYHYERGEAWLRATEHGRAAAEAARDSSANREAIESYTLALRTAERADLGPHESGILFEGRAVAHERMGSFEAARADYETALVLADTSSTRIRLLGALGMLWGGHKDYERGAELTRQAVDLALSSGEARAQADASVQLGILLLNLLRVEEGRQALERALALYQQLDDEHGQARTLDGLGLLSLCGGHFTDAVAYLTDAYERLNALGDRFGAVSCASMIGDPLAFLGRRLEAERWLSRALEIASELGLPSAEAFCWMILAEGLDPYGAYARADNAAQRALTIAREIEHREWTLAAYGPIGRVRRARGDRSGALAAHQEMLAIARDVGSALWTTEALANVALDQLTLGDLDAARAASDEAIRVGGQYQKGNVDAWLTRLHLFLLDGRPADALREARAARTLMVDFRVRLPEIVVLEGAALAALGHPVEAEATYREALESARAVGAAPGLWQAARALDDLLTGLGRTSEAAPLRAAVDAELDALAVDLAEPNLRQTLASQPSLLGAPSDVQ